MKRILSISAIVLLSLLLVFTLDSCKKVEDGAISAYVSTGEECPYDEFLPNFSGTHVYGYRADDFFFVPSMQSGGYDESGSVDAELGINIFALTEASLVPGDYTIDGGSGMPGTGYLYYLPDAGDFGNQYVSDDMQEGAKITVVLIQKSSAPDPVSGRAEIEEWSFYVNDHVTMRHISTDELICITGLSCRSEGAN